MKFRNPSLAIPPFFALVLTLLIAGSSASVTAQQIGGLDRERAEMMLETIKRDVKNDYYDSTFKGSDIDARFKAASEKLKGATSHGQLFGIIAQALMEFDDSHTYFLPPTMSARAEYGWQWQMIGDKCFVTAVKPKSDANAKGLSEGDEVLSIDGFAPNRQTLWKIKYAYYTLRPRSAMRVVIRKPNGKETQLDILAKVHTGKQRIDLGSSDIWDLERQAENEARFNRHRFYEVGDEVFIWKMPQFDMSEADVDEMMTKVRKRKSLILDLRGNGGGAVITLERLVGHFFDRDITIGELKGRKKMKPQVGKTRGDKAYNGQVIVLIDSESGSAAELFARVMQLEHRATVIGDRSSGAVMQSRLHDHEVGVGEVAYYAVSVTDADIVMSDGKSLERVGVTPDEVLLPTPIDMAAGRDVVMARAAALVGLPLDADKAGKLFPIEWRQ